MSQKITTGRRYNWGPMGAKQWEDITEAAMKLHFHNKYKDFFMELGMLTESIENTIEELNKTPILSFEKALLKELKADLITQANSVDKYLKKLK